MACIDEELFLSIAQYRVTGVGISGQKIENEVRSA
jgi:hypothetical protein